MWYCEECEYKGTEKCKACQEAEEDKAYEDFMLWEYEENIFKDWLRDENMTYCAFYSNINAGIAAAQKLGLLVTKEPDLSITIKNNRTIIVSSELCEVEYDTITKRRRYINSDGFAEEWTPWEPEDYA